MLMVLLRVLPITNYYQIGWLCLVLAGCGGGGGASNEGPVPESPLNTAPTISGAPPDMPVVGEHFQFTPTAEISTMTL